MYAYANLITFYTQVHIVEASNVADHCCTYALSSSKEEPFLSKCDHSHDQFCSSCEELKFVLSSIESALTTVGSSFSENDRDDMIFSFRLATQQITAWKAHQLRSVQQDKARTEVLEQLDENAVLITQDWAMKFLPQKYRETQSEWFGKRGISWHISVVVRRLADGKLQHQAFVHVAENCSQDANAVIAMIRHTLQELKKEHPSISLAFLRQDNAGCYHNGNMLVACHLMGEATGIKVKRIDFSDPQGGKGPCDRKAATIKAHVRRYINEGHDVTTAAHLRDAILSSGGVRGVRVVLIDASIIKPVETIKIDGISTLNDVLYKDQGLTVWKAYKIGKGKTLLYSDLQSK